MPYYALIYETVDHYAERRTPFRADHLALARAAQARGELVMAGALGDPIAGALLVFQAEDRAVAEHFARQDPYVVNGLIRKWDVHPWAVVIGGQSAMP